MLIRLVIRQRVQAKFRRKIDSLGSRWSFIVTLIPSGKESGLPSRILICTEFVLVSGYVC